MLSTTRICRQFAVLSSLVVIQTLTVSCGGGDQGSSVTVRAEGFSVPAGTEKFLCFTMTLEEAADIERISYDSRAVVHHLMLAETMTPEPEGSFECDALLSPNWLPVFGAGASTTEVVVPEGAAFRFDEGTQLILQLHLLNTSTEDITDDVEIVMEETDLEEPEPVGLYVLGHLDIELPPREETVITSDCAVDRDLDVFAAFPHMHYKGKSLRFTAGSDDASLREVFEVPLWDFDRQFIRPLDTELTAGELTRTSCTYFNDTDEVITFGESSDDEMCFMLLYATGYEGLENCLSGDLGEPGDPGGECMPEENELGIGAPCTNGGGECADGLSCSADLRDTEEGFCMSVGECEASADCGSGATCCSPEESGGLVNVCLPDECVPSDCEVKP